MSKSQQPSQKIEESGQANDGPPRDSFEVTPRRAYAGSVFLVSAVILAIVAMLGQGLAVYAVADSVREKQEFTVVREQLLAERSALEQEITEKREKAFTATRALADLDRTILGKQKDRERALTEVDDLLSRSNDLLSRSKKLRKNLVSMMAKEENFKINEQRRDALDRDVQELVAQLATKDQEVRSKRKDLQTLNGETAIARSDLQEENESLDELRGSSESLRKESVRLRTLNSVLERDEALARSRIQDLKKRSAGLADEDRDTKVDLDATKRHVAEAKAELKETLSAREAAVSALSKVQRDRETVRNLLNKERLALQRKQTESDELHLVTGSLGELREQRDAMLEEIGSLREKLHGLNREIDKALPSKGKSREDDPSSDPPHEKTGSGSKSGGEN